VTAPAADGRGRGDRRLAAVRLPSARTVALYCHSSTLYTICYHNYSVPLFQKQQCDRTLGATLNAVLGVRGGGARELCMRQLEGYMLEYDATDTVRRSWHE
jgi:hypothetical protein